MLKGFFTKFGCLLIGWNKSIFDQCGEASVRQFYKLISAIVIMMILWGTIGSCFAMNYMNISSIWGIAAVALAFLMIILCIERVIILTVGKARVMGAIRILLAIVMATLGSTIFDQMIFRNDIDAELKELRTQKVEKIVESRVKVIDREYARLSNEIDSLMPIYEEKREEYQKKPVIETPSVETKWIVKGRDENGDPIHEKVYEKKITVSENPIKKDLDMLEKTIDSNNEKKNALVDKKLHIQETVIAEVNGQPSGFIEELMATIQVVKQSGWTIAFYLVMFAFLMLLETFVVSIKLADTKCDYDMIVEHQLMVKELQLKKAERDLKTQLVSNQDDSIENKDA